MSFCSTCEAKILWASTVKGGRMPVDFHPAPGGNVRLVILPSGKLQAEVVKPGSEDGLHYSHFFTCPDASIHRRRGTTSSR